MSEYILFCSQEANFQTRSMLIPYDKYLLCKELQDDFAVLQKHSRSHKFKIKGKEYVVDNLLINNIIWNDNCGKSEIFEYTNIIDNLLSYACGWDAECYIRLCDKIWYDHSIINITGGFNHIVNYCNLQKMTSYRQKPIKIVMGFLVLETDDGELKMTNVDTVEEMLNKYYCL